MFIVAGSYCGPTSFFKRIGQRTHLYEITPTDRTDYQSVRGWTNTLRKSGITADVVFMGNSITCGSDFTEYFDDKVIINLGYPGDDLEGITFRAEQVATLSPKKVFVMAGINGLSCENTETFKRKYERLIRAYQEAVPDAELYFESILPTCPAKLKGGYASNDKIQDANEIIKSLCADAGCTYVDLHSTYQQNGEMPAELSRDGVHLMPEAYAIWAKAIERYMN